MKIKIYRNSSGKKRGNELYQTIHPKLNENKAVEIQFHSITSIDAPFLFHAFGKLYETIPIIVVREKLILKFTPEQKHLEYLFKNVMTYSETFYLDKKFRSETMEFVQLNQRNNQ